MSKPKLVLIGEVHPAGLEDILKDIGILSVKVKTGKAGARYVVDRTKNIERAKKAIRLIAREVDKKEVKILRKEKIKRLFLEMPDDKGYVRAFERLRRTGDFKKVKEELRVLDENMWHEELNLTEKMVKTSEFRKSLEKHFLESLRSVKQKGHVRNIFSLSKITVSHRAEITDIYPVDDIQSWRENCSLSYLLYGIPYNRELKELERGILQRIYALNKKREAKMAQYVREKFIEGSALIVGLNHLPGIRERLKSNFKIKEYRVGEDVERKLEELM